MKTLKAIIAYKIIIAVILYIIVMSVAIFVHIQKTTYRTKCIPESSETFEYKEDSIYIDTINFYEIKGDTITFLKSGNYTITHDTIYFKIGIKQLYVYSGNI